MGEVTRAEFDQLRTMVEETYWMARGVLQSLQGKEPADAFAASIERFCDPGLRRFREGTPVYMIQLEQAAWRLIDADILTVEEAAQRSRRDVAAIRGVGRVSMKVLDEAIAERGLAWAQAA